MKKLKKTETKRKQKPIKHKVKHAAIVVNLETLSIDALFEEIHSDPAPRKRRKRGSVPRRGKETDAFKHDLIKRIVQIYNDNDFGIWGASDLDKYTKEQLRSHLNQLQWGLSWIVKKGIMPDPPDEYPVDGFCCTAGFKRIWTNNFFCTMRKQYPTLYRDCGICRRELDNVANESN